MISLLCDVLVYHRVTIIFVTTCKIDGLHQITVVAYSQLKIFTIFLKVSDTKWKYMFDFKILD